MLCSSSTLFRCLACCNSSSTDLKLKLNIFAFSVANWPDSFSNWSENSFIFSNVEVKRASKYTWGLIALCSASVGRLPPGTLWSFWSSVSIFLMNLSCFAFSLFALSLSVNFLATISLSRVCINCKITSSSTFAICFSCWNAALNVFIPTGSSDFTSNSSFCMILASVDWILNFNWLSSCSSKTIFNFSMSVKYFSYLSTTGLTCSSIWSIFPWIIDFNPNFVSWINSVFNCLSNELAFNRTLCSDDNNKGTGFWSGSTGPTFVRSSDNWPLLSSDDSSRILRHFKCAAHISFRSIMSCSSSVTFCWCVQCASIRLSSSLRLALNSFDILEQVCPKLAASNTVVVCNGSSGMLSRVFSKDDSILSADLALPACCNDLSNSPNCFLGLTITCSSSILCFSTCVSTIDSIYFCSSVSILIFLNTLSNSSNCFLGLTVTCSSPVLCFSTCVLTISDILLPISFIWALPARFWFRNSVSSKPGFVLDWLPCFLMG